MTEEFDTSRTSDPADHRRTPGSPDATVAPAAPFAARSWSGVAPRGHDVRTPGEPAELKGEEARPENFINENEIMEGVAAPGDTRVWVVSYGNDSREREWLVEICLVLGVAVIVFIVLSSGIFEPAPASAAGEESMGPGRQAVAQARAGESVAGVIHNGVPHDLVAIHNTTNPQRRDGFPSYVQPGVLFANAHDVLERGLGDGATTLQQLASVLVLAFSSNRKETTAPGEESPREPAGAGKGNSGRAAVSICHELSEFVRPDPQLSDGAAPRFLALDFKDSPRIRGCLASLALSGDAKATRYAVGISVDADPPVHVAGFRRESVRYIVALNVSQGGEVLSGRLRVVMPGRGTPLDDGIGNDFYRLGDELAWDGDISCASWILGHPENGGLQYADDHRGAPRSTRRTGAPPPRDQILQIATALSGLTAK